MKKFFSLFLTVALILSLGSVLILAGADFVPSAEFNDAPIILTPSVPAEDLPSDYDPADEIKAIITDASGNKTYIPESELVVISLSEAYHIVDKGIYDDKAIELSNQLINAYKGIQASLTEAVTGLEEFVAELGFTAPEITVKNIFELGDGLDLSNGAKADIIFGNNMDVVEGGFIVAHYVDGAWVIVDADKVVFDDNNGIHVEFDSLCPVVFISVEETAEETTVEGDVSDETTAEDETTVGGDVEPKPSNSWLWIIIVVAVVAAVGVTVFVLYKKGVFTK